MPCDHVHFPRGGGAIVCTRGRQPRRNRCGFCHAQGGFQCDWKVGEGKTCDVHICPEHGKEVAPNKHLCPYHQEAYDRWLAERGKEPA